MFKLKLLLAYLGVIALIIVIMLIVKSVIELTTIYISFILIITLLAIWLIKPYYKFRQRNKPMKTVTDFKRKIQIGVELETLYHKQWAGNDYYGNPKYQTVNLGIAPVSIVKRKRNGECTDSWINFPKASECKIVDPSTIEIYERNNKEELELVLTYKFVNKESG